ncbi:MAG: hypothetical protein ABII18_00510 [bacterium]|nr:ParB/RepB/Spo0J family partition protein [bacterium]MBU1917084.1 ParB/RepB/Spo0J family partition protein [bacterium]
MKKSKHPRALKADNNFFPIPVDDNDEMYPNGMFVFNVTKMQQHLNDNPDLYPTETILVEDYKDFCVIDEDHLETVDLAKPVILAEIRPDHFNLVDGHHRVTKAHRQGVKEIKAQPAQPARAA